MEIGTGNTRFLEMVSHKDQKGACIKNSLDEVKMYQVTYKVVPMMISIMMSETDLKSVNKHCFMK